MKIKNKTSCKILLILSNNFTLNFIRRKMKEYARLEREIEKARQEIGEEVA